MIKEIVFGVGLVVATTVGTVGYQYASQQKQDVARLQGQIQKLEGEANRAAALEQEVSAQSITIGELQREVEELYAISLKEEDQPTVVALGEDVEPTVAARSTVEPREVAASIADDDEVLDKLAARLGERAIATPEAGTVVGPVPGTTEYKEQVKNTLEEIRAEEEAERDARRRERMKERINERVQGYADKLLLQPHQAEEMGRIYLASMDARGELFDKMRSGEIDRSEVRDLMQAQREETEEELKIILGPVQYDELQKLEEEDRGGRWGGRRGGRRGGDNNDDGGGPSQ